MNTDRIDFISAYCDRWCERCAFTSRCSSFACTLAIGMCGDFAEGLELAVGTPSPAGSERAPTVGETLPAEFFGVQPSCEELEETERTEEARDVRVNRHPLARGSKSFGLTAWKWLDGRSDLEASADPVVREAFAIAAWDAVLIGAKLNRALDGSDRRQRGEDVVDDDPVQNDANGSAKVALISLERSALAWHVIADATGDAAAAEFSRTLESIRRAALVEFPDAMAFVRPGFDEPGR